MFLRFFHTYGSFQLKQVKENYQTSVASTKTSTSGESVTSFRSHTTVESPRWLFFFHDGEDMPHKCSQPLGAGSWPPLAGSNMYQKRGTDQNTVVYVYLISPTHGQVQFYCINKRLESCERSICPKPALFKEIVLFLICSCACTSLMQCNV